MPVGIYTVRLVVLAADITSELEPQRLHNATTLDSPISSIFSVACSSAGRPLIMGQATSRDAQGQRPRNRLRSTSWAPTSSPPPLSGSDGNDQVPETAQQRPLFSRPASQRLNPFNVPSIQHLERPDAGSFAAAAPLLTRRRSRMTRARSSLTYIPNLIHRRLSTRTRPGDPEIPQTPSSAASFPVSSRPTLRHTATTGYEQRPTYLPRLQVPDLDLNFDELPANSNFVSPLTQTSRLGSARRDGRAMSMLPTFRPDRSLRSMTSSFSRRRSPVRREEDQAAMLSR